MYATQLNHFTGGDSLLPARRSTRVVKDLEIDYRVQIGLIEITIKSTKDVPASVLRFPITKTKTVVGRYVNACDVVVNDPIVSKQHLVIRCFSSGLIFAEELGSANGTLLQTPTVPIQLEKGMQLQVAIGQVLLLGIHGSISLVVKEIDVGIMNRAQLGPPMSAATYEPTLLQALDDAFPAEAVDDDSSPPPSNARSNMLATVEPQLPNPARELTPSACETNDAATPVGQKLRGDDSETDDDETPPPAVQSVLLPTRRSDLAAFVSSPPALALSAPGVAMSEAAINHQQPIDFEATQDYVMPGADLLIFIPENEDIPARGMIDFDATLVYNADEEVVPPVFSATLLTTELDDVCPPPLVSHRQQSLAKPDSANHSSTTEGDDTFHKLAPRTSLSLATSASSSDRLPLTPMNSPANLAPSARTFQMSSTPAAHVGSSPASAVAIPALPLEEGEFGAQAPFSVTPPRNQVPLKRTSAACEDEEPQRKGARSEQSPAAPPAAPAATPSKKRQAPSIVPTPKPAATARWQYKFDLRKANSKPEAWKDYAPAQSALIEAAHVAYTAAKRPRKAQTQVKLDDTYLVDFIEMVQQRQDDESRQRPVRRV